MYEDAPTTRENMIQRITTACQNIPGYVLFDCLGQRNQLFIDIMGETFNKII